MFRNLFSFNGRIRRLEFAMPLIIYWVVFFMFIFRTTAISPAQGDSVRSGNYGVFILIWIPILWVLWAQGAKRCHDRGKSDWWLIIPFYVLFMLFQPGDNGENEYGPDPKDGKNFTEETN